MDAKPIDLRLDGRTTGQICLERDGVPVDIEAACKEGFRISPQDAPTILSWAAAWINAQDFNHG